MIGLIFAQSSNGFIGKDNKLLFSIPEDMKRFKELTTYSTVVMGRKTWESLPSSVRPLPNRINIVLSRDPNFKADGAVVYDSLEKALVCTTIDTWVIGGESVLNEALQYANVIEQTHVLKEFEGDTKAPFIDPEKWINYSKSPIKEHGDLLYKFNTFLRMKS